MKTRYKKIGAGLLAAVMLWATAFSAPVSEAKSAPKTEETVAQLAVVGADGTLQSPLSLYSTSTSGIRGEVIGDGVKLRRTASSTGTVLELMYYGEIVRIDPAKIKNDWYYVTRVKTGTKGYASKKYIIIS